MKDYQRAKVYAWEDLFVGPLCPGIVPYVNGQTYVDGVWLANGWVRPPRVMPVNSKRYAGKATHGEIFLSPAVPGWVVLHEIAHTLTDDKHGPNFVGLYIDLLERVERLSRLVTMHTLRECGVDFNLGAKPLEWVIKR